MHPRLYPINRAGAVDEWTAIELQKQRAAKDSMVKERDGERKVKDLYL